MNRTLRKKDSLKKHLQKVTSILYKEMDPLKFSKYFRIIMKKSVKISLKIYNLYSIKKYL